MIGWEEPEGPAAAADSDLPPTKAAQPAMQTATFAPYESPTPTESPETSSGMKKWWLIAACVTVLAVGAGAVFMLSGRAPSDPSLAGTGSNGGPPAAEATPFVATAFGAESSDESEPPDSPLPADKSDTANVASPAAATAEPRPVPKPAPKAKPAPVRVAATPKPKPKPVPKPAPKAEPAPVRVAATPKPEPKPVPKPSPRPSRRRCAWRRRRIRNPNPPRRRPRLSPCHPYPYP